MAATSTARTAMAFVRYQVSDIERAFTFYVQHLGFQLEHRAGAVFAQVSRGDLHLLLGGPGSSGARTLSDGRRQVPGGDNRIVLYVDWGAGGWSRVFDVLDNGLAYGGSALTASGYAGFRTDFMDVELENYYAALLE